jgi:hypothetical protein
MHNMLRSTFVSAVLYSWSWPDPLCLVLLPNFQPWCKFPFDEAVSARASAAPMRHACGHCVGRRPAAVGAAGAGGQLQNPGLPEVGSCPQMLQGKITTFARLRYMCTLVVAAQREVRACS